MLSSGLTDFVGIHGRELFRQCALVRPVTKFIHAPLQTKVHFLHSEGHVRRQLASQRPRVNQFRQLVGKLFAHHRYKHRTFSFRSQSFEVAVDLFAHFLGCRPRPKRCRNEKEIPFRRGQVSAGQRHAGQLLQSIVAEELHGEPLCSDEQYGVIVLLRGRNGPGQDEMARIEIPGQVAVLWIRFDRRHGIGAGRERSEFLPERG